MGLTSCKAYPSAAHALKGKEPLSPLFSQSSFKHNPEKSENKRGKPPLFLSCSNGPAADGSAFGVGRGASHHISDIELLVLNFELKISYFLSPLFFSVFCK